MGAVNHDKQAQTGRRAFARRVRKEIDRIDETMHRLLMERGDIIDR